MRLISALAMMLSVCADALPQPADPVPKLLKALQSKDAEKRSDALVALGELGPKAEAAVPTLAAMLPGVDEEDRVLAALALGKIGRASLPAVEKLLDHEDETTRYYAVWVVGLVGKDAEAFTPRLLRMFAKDADHEVRVKAAQALSKVAAGSAQVRDVFLALANMADDTSPEREAALSELRHFGVDALAPLAKALRAPPMTVMPEIAYESMLHILEKNKADAAAEKTLPFARDLLTHVPPMNFLNAAPSDEGLAWLVAKHGVKLLPRLTEQLKGKDASEAYVAVQALGQMGMMLHRRSEDPELLQQITALLRPHFRSPDRAMRLQIATSAPLTDATKSDFEALFLDLDPHIRNQAVARVSQEGIDVIANLQARLKKAKGDDQFRYALALWPLLGDDNMRKSLAPQLEHKDPLVRLSVAAVLHNDAKAVPVLLDALKSKNADHRLLAAQALASMAEVLGKDVSALLERLDDPSPDVRMYLLAALQQRAPADKKKVLLKVVPLLKDENVLVQMNALSVLSILGKEGASELGNFVEHDKSPHLWENACMNLAGIGPGAKAAAQSLLCAAEKPERWSAVVMALNRVDPDGSYGPLLEILKKRDAIVRKTLNYPKAAESDPAKMAAALLADWSSAKGPARQPIIYTLRQVFPLLPPKHQYATAFAGSKLLSAEIETIKKTLKAKDVKDRLDAVETIGAAQKLWMSWTNMMPAENAAGKDWEAFFQRNFENQNALNELLSLARTDSDLQVRRLARRLQSTEMNAFPGPPFFRGVLPVGAPDFRFPIP